MLTKRNRNADKTGSARRVILTSSDFIGTKKSGCIKQRQRWSEELGHKRTINVDKIVFRSCCGILDPLDRNQFLKPKTLIGYLILNYPKLIV